MKYETNDRYKINTHSFRAYGITKISRHDPNFAKMLAGQKGYLIREYDRMTDKEKLDLYIKYENELCIFNKQLDNNEKIKDIINSELKRLLKEQGIWKQE